MSDEQSVFATRPIIGIGSCLAGNAVRYNRQTKNPNKHVRAIAQHVEVRAFCPEMGIGMGVPRAPIHLVGSASAVRALDVETHSKDYTDALAAYATTVLSLAPGMSGYILVKGSPSCGYARVKRHADTGSRVASDQQGIFAAALARADPLLPLEDDGRLHDPRLRESFVTRAHAYHDWKRVRHEGLNAHKLQAFYHRYKYLVMAHHIPSYNSLGRMLAGARSQPIQLLSDRFIAGLMTALSHHATRRSHSNVLHHLSCHLKHPVASADRLRLQQLIAQYRLGEAPIMAPVTLLRQHFANKPNAYLEGRVFLAPCPGDPGPCKPA